MQSLQVLLTLHPRYQMHDAQPWAPKALTVLAQPTLFDASEVRISLRLSLSFIRVRGSRSGTESIIDFFEVHIQGDGEPWALLMRITNEALLRLRLDPDERTLNYVYIICKYVIDACIRACIDVCMSTYTYCCTGRCKGEAPFSWSRQNCERPCPMFVRSGEAADSFRSCPQETT